MAGTRRQARRGISASQAGTDRRRAARRGAALSGIAAAAVLVAACGSSAANTAASGYGSGGGGSSGKAAAANSTVSTRQLSGIGTVLVNGSGRTIYQVKTPAETNGRLHCMGACTSFWFPVTASSANPGGSGLPGTLGTVRRPGGQTQLTYNGRPLYTFRLDTAPGQAHGNNYTDQFSGTSFTWQAVTASGKPAGGGSAPAPASSSSGSGGYGY